MTMSVDLARVRSFVDAQPTVSDGCLNVHSSVKTLYNQNEIKYMYFVAYTWRASILVI